MQSTRFERVIVRLIFVARKQAVPPTLPRRRLHFDGLLNKSKLLEVFSPTTGGFHKSK